MLRTPASAISAAESALTAPRYYKSMEALVRGTGREEEVYKIELLLKQAHVTIEERKVVPAALKREEETGAPAAAMELAEPISA